MAAVVAPAVPDHPDIPLAVVEHRILLISPPESYRIQPYVRAAQSLGLEVYLASHGEWALSSPFSAGVEIPMDDPAAALEILQKLTRQTRFDAIIGTDDSTLELAAQLAKLAGLEQNSADSVRIARRKDLARAALKKAGLQVPEFIIIENTGTPLTDISPVDFPCVVKPLSLSGSRGVMRADTLQEVNGCVERCCNITSQVADVYEKNHLIVEQFIPGREFALEGMLTDSRLDVLAIFDKPAPLDGPYFEETYYISPARINRIEREQIVRCVQQACAAYGLIKGPVHAECRLNKSGAWLIELAARTIGGMCGRLLTFGTGFSLEKLVLTNATGNVLDRAVNTEAAGVLMLPLEKAGVLRRVEGVLEAEKVEGIDEIQISIREGYRVEPLPEGSSYLGFVFAQGASPDAVEHALREANQLIRPVIAPLWNVEQAKKEASV